jgi:small subunit ribosomal protein S2
VKLNVWVFLYLVSLILIQILQNIDFVIPANDDATKSIEAILDPCCAAIAEGLEERKAEKIDMEAAGEAKAAAKGKEENAKS